MGRENPFALIQPLQVLGHFRPSLIGDGHGARFFSLEGHGLPGQSATPHINFLPVFSGENNDRIARHGNIGGMLDGGYGVFRRIAGVPVAPGG